MANQPPVRPWFRLSSLRSVSAPPSPAPAQKPRPSLVQPTNRTNSPSPPAAPVERGSVPSSPAQKLPVQSPSSSSLPTSPVQKEPVKAFSSVSSSSPTQKSAPPPSASSPAKGEMTARGSSPSTKQAVQNLMQSSPKAKPTTPPTQKTHNEKIKGNHRKLSDSEKSVAKLITIAGENRGAYMELIQSPKKHEFGNKPNYLYTNGNGKTKTGNGESGSSSSDEGNGNKKENKSNGERKKSSYPMAAFMNSNVQCVNNSFMYNASCSHHDPGLHLSLSKKPLESGGFRLKEVVNGRHD